jgi:hypothetical protein
MTKKQIYVDAPQRVLDAIASDRAMDVALMTVEESVADRDYCYVTVRIVVNLPLAWKEN